MKEIFHEEFQKQRKHFINIISGNFELSIKKINMKKEISDLRESLVIHLFFFMNNPFLILAPKIV